MPKFLIKKFVREIILEKSSGGQRLDTLTGKIVDIIIRKLRSSEVYQKISNKISATFEILDEEMGDLQIPLDKIVVQFIINPDLDELSPEIYARSDSTLYESIITLTIEYPDRPFRITDIQAIREKIDGSIRHELEHLSQFASYGTHALPSNLRTLRDFFAYYLDPSEIESYTTEMHRRAQKTKMPLSEKIEEFYDEVLSNADKAGLSLDQIDRLEEELRLRYETYSKIRYPQSK